MKNNPLLVIAGAITISLVTFGQTVQGQTNPVSQVQTRTLTASEQQLVQTFEKRAKEYVKMREHLEEQMPKLSKEAKPEEIQTHKKQFQERVRAARTGAKQGDVFTPEAMTFIRAVIKDEFKGKERVEFRDTVLREAENKGVPLRVNYPYPESQELLEMPATLLMRLPQLPKQLRFRFVGRNLLLVDRENGLIVDYMTNALP
jgi:hypothetical protein